jgi:hypothetical protein
MTATTGTPHGRYVLCGNGTSHSDLVLRRSPQPADTARQTPNTTPTPHEDTGSRSLSEVANGSGDLYVYGNRTNSAVSLAYPHPVFFFMVTIPL